jgi:hypothetical protein
MGTMLVQFYEENRGGRFAGRRDSRNGAIRERNFLLLLIAPFLFLLVCLVQRLAQVADGVRITLKKLYLVHNA